MKASEATQRYFQEAADRLGLSSSMQKLLVTPMREVTV